MATGDVGSESNEASKAEMFCSNHNWESWFRITVCNIVSIEFCSLVERERVVCRVLDQHDEV